MRDLTCKVFAAMDDGALSPRAIAEMCLSYMNEDDMREMLRQNDVLDVVEPDEDDDDLDFDGDEPYFDYDGDALASAGMGTDEDYGHFGGDDY